MFGLGIGEILLILALALIFVGPSKLPEIAKGLGKGYGEFRRYMNEFKDVVDVSMAEEAKKPEANTAAAKVYEEHYKDSMKEEAATVEAEPVQAEAVKEVKEEKKQDA